jgi:hypothetical protein
VRITAAIALALGSVLLLGCCRPWWQTSGFEPSSPIPNPQYEPGPYADPNHSPSQSNPYASRPNPYAGSPSNLYGGGAYEYEARNRIMEGTPRA